MKRKAEAVGENRDQPTTRRSSRLKSSGTEIPSLLYETPSAKPAQKPENEKKKTHKASRTKAPEKSTKVLPKVTEDAKGPYNGSQGEQQYWLMKAEPESRIEKGHDIKFSIDDLAAKKEPEPWDGIRNHVARNNLRAMKKGDLAFFYHSSCKIPAIVGIMEIVKEHSPDLSAQDSKAPYYDAKDVDSKKPKWSVVHVEFRRKLNEPVTLKELREFGEKGGKLEGMQILKQGRLSVSKVSKEEWEFLMSVIKEREEKE